MTCFLELAILNSAHATIPNVYRKTAQGLILNFEVDDVNAEYDRLILREKSPSGRNGSSAK